MIQNEIWIELDRGTLVHICYLQNRNCLRLIMKSWKFFIVYFILSIAPIHVIAFMWLVSLSFFTSLVLSMSRLFLLLSSIRESLEYNSIPFPPFSFLYSSFSSHSLPFPTLPFSFIPYPSLPFPFPPFPSLSFPFAPFPSISFLPYPSLCRPS